MKGDVLALALLTAGEQAHAFSAYLPSHFTIRNWVLEGKNQREIDANICNLRSGYLPSLAFGLGLGAVISFIAKSPLPFLFSVGTGAVMINLYERALPEDKRLKSPLDVIGLIWTKQVQPANKQKAFKEWKPCGSSF